MTENSPVKFEADFIWPILLVWLLFFCRGCSDEPSHWEHYLKAAYQYEMEPSKD